MAEMPNPPDGVERYSTAWFRRYLETIDTKELRTATGVAYNEIGQYLIFRERNQTGYMGYGYYERVFVEDGKEIEKPSKI